MTNQETLSGAVGFRISPLVSVILPLNLPKITEAWNYLHTVFCDVTWQKQLMLSKVTCWTMVHNSCINAYLY